METDLVTLEDVIEGLSSDQLFVLLGLSSWIQEKVAVGSRSDLATTCVAGGGEGDRGLTSLHN
jgi:hypothetical protein